MRILHIILVIVGLVMVTAPAEARRGRGGSGEAIELVHDLPDKSTYSFEGNPYDIGYLYKEYSAIIPVIGDGSEGKFVLYHDDRYIEPTADLWAEIAQDIGQDPRETYSFEGWRMMWGGYILIAFLLFGVGKKLLISIRDRETDRLMQDPSNMTGEARTARASRQPTTAEAQRDNNRWAPPVPATDGADPNGFDARVAMRLQEIQGESGQPAPATLPASQPATGFASNRTAGFGRKGQ